MCNVWQHREKNELTPVEIADYFSDPALAGLRHVGISGGEPSLSKDLVECIDAITLHFPNNNHYRSHLTVTTIIAGHGFYLK